MNAKRLCAVAAAIALGLAGCGDDDDGESGTTGTSGTSPEEEPLAPTGPAVETLKFTETEFMIDPANVTTDEDGVIEFQVKNAGSVTHALEVEGEGVEQKTADIAPGESASVKVRLADGTYELYCPIGNHADQGMTGELAVGAGSASSGEDDSSSEDDSGGGGDSGGAEAPDDDDNSGGAEAPSSGY